MEFVVGPDEVCYVDPLTKVELCGRPRSTTSAEALKYSIRRAVMAELEAINMYESMAHLARAMGYDDLAEIFTDIANEEKTHVGEFWYALSLMSDDEHYRLIGYEEAQKLRRVFIKK